MTEMNEKQAERFERIKRLALDAGAPSALPVPQSLRKIVRECIDGAALAQQPQGEAQPSTADWLSGKSVIPQFTPPAATGAQGLTSQRVEEIAKAYFHQDGTELGDMKTAIRVAVREALAQSAPRADHSGEGASVPWDMFPAWLIDHHEGETITEEGLQHALANMLKAHPPITAPSASAGQAEKTVAAIDKALRGKVNDPEPLPKLHAHSVAGEPTTYGLVAGLLRERDALLAKVAMFDQRIVDLGVLAMETAAPAPASPAALTGIPCKAFEAAFPAAADCRNKDGYHGIMAVRMEGFAAGVEAAARALPDDRISAIYYKTVQAQRKPDAGPFHIAFARALLAASPADQGEDARQLVTERMVQSALEAGWNEFVSDTGCYPACFEVQRGKRIEADFQRAEGAFLEYIAASLNAAMSASKEGA